MIVGLDHLTGLESILHMAFPECAVHLLKRKKVTFELLQKDSWCGQLNRDSDFPAIPLPNSPEG